MIIIDNMGREVVVSGEYIRDMIKEASTSKFHLHRQTVFISHLKQTTLWTPDRHVGIIHIPKHSCKCILISYILL